MATITLVVGWILALALAVGGWLVTQAQARRATRSNMRIDYLLDAYRRLDRAANRPLTPESAKDIESGIADIMLLGSAKQTALAQKFASEFADSRSAEAITLLMDLRTSLREELLLDRIPEHYVSLRVMTEGQMLSNHARIWHETVQSTRESVVTELAAHALPMPDTDAAQPGTTEGQAEPPAAQVLVHAQRLEDELRTLLRLAGAGETDNLNLAQLANRALQHRLIDPRLADTLNGLSVMRLLASVDGDSVGQAQADQFAQLSTAASQLLEAATA
jgi:hypothetical protein